jgi:phosphoribosylglycinamide formyltransferase-1
MDQGPIIAQAAIAVLDDDTQDTLAARVLKQEHLIYPAALAQVASGRLRISGNRTRGEVSAQDFSPLRVPRVGE